MVWAGRRKKWHEAIMTKVKRSLCCACVYKQPHANFIMFCTMKTFQGIMTELVSLKISDQNIMKPWNILLVVNNFEPWRRMVWDLNLKVSAIFILLKFLPYTFPPSSLINSHSYILFSPHQSTPYWGPVAACLLAYFQLHVLRGSFLM